MPPPRDPPTVTDELLDIFSGARAGRGVRAQMKKRKAAGRNPFLSEPDELLDAFIEFMRTEGAFMPQAGMVKIFRGGGKHLKLEGADVEQAPITDLPPRADRSQDPAFQDLLVRMHREGRRPVDLSNRSSTGVKGGTRPSDAELFGRAVRAQRSRTRVSEVLRKNRARQSEEASRPSLQRLAMLDRAKSATVRRIMQTAESSARSKSITIRKLQQRLADIKNEIARVNEVLDKKEP